MRKTKKELKQYVDEICALARELFPGANVRVKPPYETEDADVIVELPEGWRGGIAKQRRLLWRRTWEILLDKGYDILVFIEKPNRRKVSGDGTKKAKTKSSEVIGAHAQAQGFAQGDGYRVRSDRHRAGSGV